VDVALRGPRAVAVFDMSAHACGQHELQVEVDADELLADAEGHRARVGSRADAGVVSGRVHQLVLLVGCAGGACAASAAASATSPQVCERIRRTTSTEAVGSSDGADVVIAWVQTPHAVDTAVVGLSLACGDELSIPLLIGVAHDLHGNARHPFARLVRD